MSILYWFIPYPDSICLIQLLIKILIIDQHVQSAHLHPIILRWFVFNNNQPHLKEK